MAGGMNTTGRRWRLALAVVAASMLLFAPGAGAQTVTVGSPLVGSFSFGVNATTGTDPVTTVANVTLPEPGANVFSPITGTVVRWRLKGAGFVGGPFKLRVLRPVGGGAYAGIATSAAERPMGTGTQVFPTDLPIQAGDLIGLDDTDFNTPDRFGIALVPGAAGLLWAPHLADGKTAVSNGGITDEEWGFNADVAAPPPNDFSFGKLKRNKRNGTATLAVAVPGAGTLALTGDDVKQQPPKDTGLTAPGVVKLKVKAVGNGLFKLRHTGKAKVKVTVTYTPVGDLAAPNTESTRVKLVERK
jgi:hypothetical protein